MNNLCLSCTYKSTCGAQKYYLYYVFFKGKFCYGNGVTVLKIIYFFKRLGNEVYTDGNRVKVLKETERKHILFPIVSFIRQFFGTSF